MISGVLNGALLRSDFNKIDGSYGSNGKSNYAEGVPNQDYLAYGTFAFGPGDNKFKDLNGDGVINNGNTTMIELNGKTYVAGDPGYDEAKLNPNSKAVPVGTLKNHGDLKVVGNALPPLRIRLASRRCMEGIRPRPLLPGRR